MNKYPKILHIGAPLVETVFSEEVEVSEKVDGSQCRIELTEEYVMVGSKNQNEADHGMFAVAHEQGKRIWEEAEWKDYANEMTLFCEFMRSPKHNTIKYDRIPRNNLYLFGAIANGIHVYTDMLEDMAETFGIDPPNIMYSGMVESADELNELVTHDSYLGGSCVEGVVVKNYKRSYDPLQVHSQAFIGYPMAAKYVREDFKEANMKQWNTISRKSGVDAVVDMFFTGARFQKAVQHLDDEGKISYTKSDLRYLIPEFFNDLMDEEKEVITKMIMGDVFKSIKKRADGYVVQSWVNCLTDKQFDMKETVKTVED